MEACAQYLAGIVCILFVAVIWTLAAVLKQIIFQDLDFREPLILTYVCNVCYAAHLPLHMLGRCSGIVRRVPWRSESVNAPQCRELDTRTSSMRGAAAIGLAIVPFWFFAQWTYSLGVSMTSVTSSTVISTTSVVWTLLLSVAFLREKLTILKVLGCALCMGGNVATLLGNDTQKGQHGQLNGDILCLVSAAIYATYTTILSRFTGPNTPVTIMFGTVGIAFLIFVTPIVVIIRGHSLASLTPNILALLIFNGIFDNVLSQYAWAKAVQWTSPTAATIGLSLTIPLSVVADLVRCKPLTYWSYIASVLVVLGFFCVTASSRPPNKQEVAPEPSSPPLMAD